tara:strand:+ start:92 stop:229 length:138 start_codon:yes stop_codon:yes gene_type:complete
MKNFLIIVLLISWSVLSDDETMHKDHESMQMETKQQIVLGFNRSF